MSKTIKAILVVLLALGTIALAPATMFGDGGDPVPKCKPPIVCPL
jgi:hypothetical protein